MLKTRALRHGTFMYYPSDMIGRILDEHGEWSELELSFLLRLLDEGDVVVDVGAHIGTFTVPFAKKVGPRGAVFAFEAQRLVFQNLAGNVFLNGLPNVRTHNVVCGREPCFLNLVDLPPDRAKNTGGFRIEPTARQQRRWNHARVEPLDALLTGLPKLTLLKIDVEGYEQEVLAGARDTLRRLRPVVHCECLDETSFSFLVELAQSLDYRVHAAGFEHFNPDNFLGSRQLFGPPGARDTNALLWPVDRPLPRGLEIREVSTFEELASAPQPIWPSTRDE